MASCRAQLSKSQTIKRARNALTTNNDGAFLLPQLDPSDYTVIVTSNGFKTYIANNVRVEVGQEYSLTVPLDPANLLGLTLPSYDLGTGITPATTNGGVQTNIPQGRVANNYLFQDTVTHVRGNHTFRIGTEQVMQRSRQFAPIAERGLLA